MDEEEKNYTPKLCTRSTMCAAGGSGGRSWTLEIKPFQRFFGEFGAILGGHLMFHKSGTCPRKMGKFADQSRLVIYAGISVNIHQ